MIRFLPMFPVPVAINWRKSTERTIQLTTNWLSNVAYIVLHPTVYQFHRVMSYIMVDIIYCYCYDYCYDCCCCCCCCCYIFNTYLSIYNLYNYVYILYVLYTYIPVDTVDISQV